MTWVRIEDTMPEDPRWEETGALGLALHVAALAYSNRNLTDGVLSRSQARRLLPIDDVDVVIDLLVSTDTWRADGSSLHLVQSAEFQPTREKVLKRREDDRLRQEKSRARRAGHTVTDAVTNGVSHPYPVPSPKTGRADARAPFGRGGAQPNDRRTKEQEALDSLGGTFDLDGGGAS